MRKKQKLQCLELLNSLGEAGQELVKLIEKKKIDEAASLLEDCQQAAIGIGKTIEESEGEGTKAVQFLEEYCELIYCLREALISGETIGSRAEERRWNELLEQTRDELRYSIRTRYEAVFFPYMVSMWDSLESIWRAMAADPDCDAYVVPIPYYDKKPDDTLGQLHYDGDRYPEDVPVVSFVSFDLQKHHPEMVFIHNPFDGYNYVTSVAPEYYSNEIKKHTDCLIYVPYYVAPGGMGEAYSLLPAYLYADYVIIQSEGMKNYFDKRIPEEKLLPLGSPKCDKIIKTCRDMPAPPAEWAEKLEGKRVFFYNTSINEFLQDTEVYLEKMRRVFEYFRDRKEVCLIWRPHPLLESAMNSLRPGVRPVYEGLKRFFMENEVGIFDQTPQIENTIALCDAYLGDNATSVTALFIVAGKPLFITDEQMLNDTETFFSKLFSGWDNQAVCDREQRIEASRAINASPNGDCGEKVHCFLKLKLLEKMQEESLSPERGRQSE